MLCLHGKPAVARSTVTLGKNGKKRKSWTCPDSLLCFYCYEEEKSLYDKGIKAFLATKQDRPKCCGIITTDRRKYINRHWKNHNKRRTYTYLDSTVSAADARRNNTEFMVFTGDKNQHPYCTVPGGEEDIGRPFFVCPKSNSCGYFEWGDKPIVTNPLCHHGKPCRREKDKNYDDVEYFKCRSKNEQSCHYFEVVPKD